MAITTKSLQLTCSLSEGTRDKKSNNSLFGIALGDLNFFVNLLIPKNITIHKQD